MPHDPPSPIGPDAAHRNTGTTEEGPVRSGGKPGRASPGGPGRSGPDAARRARGMAVAAAVLAALALAACGDDGEAAVELVEGVEVEVSAIDNTFRPETIEVEAGTEVVWTNDGRNDHNVLPVEGDDWGVEAEDFAPDDEYRHRFTEPGTYPYYCSLHGTTTKGMVGTVVVTG